MDKTVKIRAYPDDAKSDASLGNLTEDQNMTLELAKKNYRLEEELKKSHEHLDTIEQLKVNLAREQAKSAEIAVKMAGLESKVKEFAALDASELAKKNTLLEEEQRKSAEHIKMIGQLRESLKQEQERTAEMAAKNALELESKSQQLAMLEAKLKDLPALESKVKDLQMWEAKAMELTAALGKISSIAAAGKVGQ